MAHMYEGASAAMRDCGSCHLCCRVFPIPEANKPHVDWCDELVAGSGCVIYPRRPVPCRDFSCLWARGDLIDGEPLGENWRPDIAGFVLSDPAPWALLVTNDLDRPSAWRMEPYQSQIRALAHGAQLRGQFVGVREGERLMLVFAEGEIDIQERLPERV